MTDQTISDDMYHAPELAWATAQWARSDPGVRDKLMSGCLANLRSPDSSLHVPFRAAVDATRADETARIVAALRAEVERREARGLVAGPVWFDVENLADLIERSEIG